MIQRRTLEQLRPQDYLYTVLEKGPEFVRANVIAVLREVLFARKDTAKLIAAFTHADTKIVTLTITPSGYAVQDKFRGGAGLGPGPGHDVSRGSQAATRQPPSGRGPTLSSPP